MNGVEKKKVEKKTKENLFLSGIFLKEKIRGIEYEQKEEEKRIELQRNSTILGKKKEKEGGKEREREKEIKQNRQLQIKKRI